MDILTIAVVGTLNIVCFLIGAKVGQTVQQGKEIEVPEINPVKIYHQKQEQKEAEREFEKMEIILQNIERYDGTEIGQKDVPR